MLVLEHVSAARADACVCAGVELCLALWAATAPEREPLSPTARRFQAAMPSGARHALTELDGQIPGWPLWLVSALHRGEPDLDGELARLAARDPREVARDMLHGVARGRLPADAAAADPLVAVLEGGTVPASLMRPARRLAARPELVVMQMLDVLGAFADAGFRKAWQDYRGQLESIARQLAGRLQADVPQALASLSPRAILNRREDRLTFLGAEAGRVDCRAPASLQVVPSVWLRRRVVLAHAPGRVGLALGRGPVLRDELDPDRVPAMLAALGDARRYEILRLCLQQPRTTAELSPLLGITEGPVSRHLKVLERDGIVVGHRVGRHVRYSAVVEELHLLGRRLQRLPQLAWAERTGEPASLAA